MRTENTPDMGTPFAPTESNVEPLSPQPQVLYVMKRDNQTLTPYNPDKIKIAITKAYLAVEGGNAAESRRVHEVVETLTKDVYQALSHTITNGGIVPVEEIQDQVELAIMQRGLHKVARTYILYREKRRLVRESHPSPSTTHNPIPIHIILNDGSKVPLDSEKLAALVYNACWNLQDVDPNEIIEETRRNVFDGISLADLRKALIMSTRTKIEKEPNYSFVAARLLLNDLHIEALHLLGMPTPHTLEEKYSLYPEIFKIFIQRGIEYTRLTPSLQEFDLEQLGKELRPERDNQFTYLGLQTLYDRYFLHAQSIRFELPQMFFMRIAMGLALNEKDKNQSAIEFYHVLSSFDYMCSTPTLFNSGTLRPQLSSCFLTTVPDELAGIYNALKDNALLSKYAGGLGNDWTSVRAMGAHIQGTNGKSQGIVPFLKVANDTAVAVNQGGKRKGAVCAYLESWHLDIEEFLDLRKNTGDDRRRTHDMNTANWIPDLFMKRVNENKAWTLFSPEEVSDLHDLFGQPFEIRYCHYEHLAQQGKIKNFKKISAVSLWRKMLGMIFETGHPWITFKDPCNLRSPQQHIGVVHSSNLCTEITLNTSQDEIAVCNLGSINLAQHLTKEGLDLEKLEKTVTTALRMLDNVIDINYYSVPQAKNANLKHRPVGLGLMGFQDALYLLNIPYASKEAIDFSDFSMEAISYYALLASSLLAKERGNYPSYKGSLWHQGILPIDSINLLIKHRGEYLEQNQNQTLDWAKLRAQVKTQGMRNSNVMAIAPTATISNICGVQQSIEPIYQNLYVKSNLSGEFTVVNPYLVADLKALNLWDDVLVNDLKYFNGSVQDIDRIPTPLKQKYATAFEIDPTWLIEAASRRQKWIDQSQSLNIYIHEPSGKKLDSIYQLAWRKGLKTTYYCRTLGASDAEKSTLNQSTLNAVSATPINSQSQKSPNFCSIDDPSCESCQ